MPFKQFDERHLSFVAHKHQEECCQCCAVERDEGEEKSRDGVDCVQRESGKCQDCAGKGDDCGEDCGGIGAR